MHRLKHFSELSFLDNFFPSRYLSSSSLNLRPPNSVQSVKFPPNSSRDDFWSSPNLTEEECDFRNRTASLLDRCDFPKLLSNSGNSIRETQTRNEIQISLPNFPQLPYGKRLKMKDMGTIAKPYCWNNDKIDGKFM